MMGGVLVVLEHDRGDLSPASLEALTAGRGLTAQMGVALEAVVVGDADVAEVAAQYGATVVHQVAHPMLADYGPEAWGESVVQLIGAVSPSAVIAVGTDRGNEVLAHVAASLDLPFVANCVAVEVGDVWSVTRVQWGGSLLEDATLSAATKIVSFAHHAVEAEASQRAIAEISTFEPDLDASLERTVITDRVVLSSGVTLSTAPVVVSGGRGVGSEAGFAQIEELAELLGGRVGCSRAVTNNGWRPHSDQVGQTGTRIAPEIYIACGISGAIQHWVGAMGSKNILAINTDAEANMVTKAGYAVIADLHEVIPAITAEIKRRRNL